MVHRHKNGVVYIGENQTIYEFRWMPSNCLAQTLQMEKTVIQNLTMNNVFQAIEDIGLPVRGLESVNDRTLVKWIDLIHSTRPDTCFINVISRQNVQYFGSNQDVKQVNRETNMFHTISVKDDFLVIFRDSDHKISLFLSKIDYHAGK